MIEVMRIIKRGIPIAIIVGVMIGGVTGSRGDSIKEEDTIPPPEQLSVDIEVGIRIQELYEQNLRIAEELAREHEDSINTSKEMNLVQKSEESKKELEIKLKSKESKGMLEEQLVTVSRGGNSHKEFTITAYDLSKDSCGKVPGDKHYGITSTGKDLRGETRESAMVVASDPKIIPMNTEIEIVFANPDYSKFNGIYTTQDTGGAIKGLKLDIFMGDFDSVKSHQSVWDFGKTKARVRIIK